LRKLRQKLRKEQKGAERELRRDTQFIQAERLKRKIQQDALHRQQVKQATAMIQRETASLTSSKKKKKSVVPL